MNKILNYLQKLGVICKYSHLYNARHYGGRCFYNDGYYSVDVYKLLDDYEIHYKCTGRAMYELYKRHAIVGRAFSQRDFINRLSHTLVKELNIDDTVFKFI